MKTGVVKRVTSLLQKDKPCLNMFLQSKPYPRLWLESTIDSDGREGIYKKDILLYGELKVSCLDKDNFQIFCPYSQKKYKYRTAEANDWYSHISNMVLQIKIEQENFD